MGIGYGELESDDAEGLIQLRLSVMKSDPYSFSVSEKEERESNKENIEKAIESYSTSKDRQMLGAWDVDLVGVVGIERYCKVRNKHRHPYFVASIVNGQFHLITNSKDFTPFITGPAFFLLN